MVTLIFKKFLHGFSILFGVLTIVFFLFKILPADPARMMLDKREDAEQLELINQKYGFNKPLSLQYLSYVNDFSFISIYSLNKDSFISIHNKEINYFKFFETTSYILVAKLPALGKSFIKQEKSVTSIIISTFKNSILYPKGFDRKNKALLLSGIGNPKSFEKSARSHGCIIVGIKRFKDHYPYNKKSLLKIVQFAKNLKADYILTTEKDWVKIKPLKPDFLFVVLKIELNISEKDKIEDIIKNNLT